MSTQTTTLREVSFKPHTSVGPLTLGEVEGQVAINVTGQEAVVIVPIAVLLLPVVIWVIITCVWWWASSDLGYADVSKVIGIISPLFGVVSEALIK